MINNKVSQKYSNLNNMDNIPITLRIDNNIMLNFQ